jgi:hypothetical protein
VLKDKRAVNPFNRPVPVATPSNKGRKLIPWRTNESQDLKVMLCQLVDVHQPHLAKDAKEKKARWEALLSSFNLDNRTKLYSEVSK